MASTPMSFACAVSRAERCRRRGFFVAQFRWASLATRRQEAFSRMRRSALVFAGGFCGTLARYALSAPLLALARLGMPGASLGVPYDILAINLSGACALGLLYGLVERGTRISPDLRLTLGTGFLGAYTTFSSLAYGGDKLLLAGNVVASLLYLAGSIGLGVLAAHMGYRLARVVSERRRVAQRGAVHARRVWRRTLRLGNTLLRSGMPVTRLDGARADDASETALTQPRRGQ